MAKYYIQTGQLKEIIDAKDYKEALKKIFIERLNKPVDLGSGIFVSEKGFFSLDDLEDNIKRHKNKAYKMLEFDNNFELDNNYDLIINSELILEILGTP